MNTSDQHSAAVVRPLLRGLLAAVVALAASAACAQASLTIYGGARGGGEFSDADTDETYKLGSGAAISASIDWPLADGRQGQIFYSYQRSSLGGSAFDQASDVDVGISYFHVGGRSFFEGDARQGGGYVVGGLGITYLSPSLSGTSDELRPSMNVGVGYQWPLGTQVSLRGELRGYVTLINSSGQFFCSGGCVVSIRGDVMLQGEAMLGLSIGF